MARLNVFSKRTVLALWMAAGNIAFYAQKEPPEDYRIKAVFLYNFTQFVEWPATAFKTTEDSLIVGIMGEDPFGRHLEEAIEGEQTNGHPLRLRRFNPDETILDCHVLFINLQEPDQTAQLLKNLRGQSILTVSDQDGFLNAGGMIQFISSESKIHFQINPDASSAADLKISSKLLRVAEIVNLPK